MLYIDPVKDIGALLLDVEKPARYTGGEYGRLPKGDSACGAGTLRTLIAFPDLYEIGMSNQALRILYKRLNAMEGVSCDRAFAPAPDFEGLLRKLKLPLYGLDTGISLKCVDILMFTLGYELGITGVLSMLDISGIPLRSRDRGDGDPVVIMGGPCVSNPRPYEDFIDAFWIGEAEGGFFDLIAEIRDSNAFPGRGPIMEHLAAHRSIWAKGPPLPVSGKTLRAIDGGFSAGEYGPAVFPAPSMKVVHHHGAVEIMRGCPNGCRFCHAGYWYRPMRQKSIALVEEETAAFIKKGGYREITLTSLSSGDYRGLDTLIDRLNAKYRGMRISFQLPSLKVSSFSLDLLEKISEVRKSGLTFAVETPDDFRQMAINKQVKSVDVVSILREARKRGWKGAKFYFMLGLPRESADSPVCGNGAWQRPEEEEIALFVEDVARQTSMHFNINVGVFVPKPHTPYQRARQMPGHEAQYKFNYLRSRLKPQGHKVGIQDSLISGIEGIASRGDGRAGAFFEEAYRLGCRLDSWTEFLKRDIWENLLEKYAPIVDEFLSQRGENQPLPWDCIDSSVSPVYLAGEEKKSGLGEITSPCSKNCTDPCGSCNNQAVIVVDESPDESPIEEPKSENREIAQIPNFLAAKKDPDTHRIIFSFSKRGSAVFHPHLAVIEVFSMAFIRADIPVKYSQGFNPLPRLEIASPLSLGISAGEEIALLDTEHPFNSDEYAEALNQFLPEGFRVKRALNVLIKSGEKKHSLSSLLWGYSYASGNNAVDFVPAREEKAYRASRMDCGVNLFGLERLAVLARPMGNNAGESPGISYFDTYRSLYPGM